MAINKKLIHFNKKEDFLKEQEAGNILNTSIVFIKDSKEIYTHGEFYDSSGGTKVTEEDFEIKEMRIIDSDDPQSVLTREEADELYQPLGESTLPEGGEVGQVLTKTEEGAEWQDKTIKLIDEDLLTLKPGSYWADHNNSCDNKPSNITAFALEVTKVGINNIHLELVSGAHKASVSNGDIFYRNCNEGTWDNWNELKFDDFVVNGSTNEIKLGTVTATKLNGTNLEISNKSTFKGDITATDIEANDVTINSLIVNRDTTISGTTKTDSLTITGTDGRIYGNKIDITSHKALDFHTNGSAYIFNKEEGKGENLYIGSTTIGIQGSSNNVLSPKAKITANGFKAEDGKANEVFTRDGGYIDISTFIDSAKYNEETKEIEFYNGENKVTTLNATPFIIDNFIESADVIGENLVLTFNAENRPAISISISKIFNPDNYYTKEQVNGKFEDELKRVNDSIPKEWFGTEDEYKALGTYNDDTKYYILED